MVVDEVVPAELVGTFIGGARETGLSTQGESIEVENGLEEDVVVESVKDLVDEDNGLIDDEFSESNSNQDIRNIEVLKLECVEIVKSGLEKWTRNGVNNIEGQVIAGDLRKYEVRLISVKDALSSRLYECLNCLEISSFVQEYVHMTKTTVEYILVTKQVFDPSGKWVCDLGGSSGRNVSGKQRIETNYKSQILVVVTSYVRVEKSLLGLKEYEFGGVEELAFLLEQVLEYFKGIRRPVRYEVRKGIKENEFVLEEVPNQCTPT
nr:hypothetical protein [Tanacetum cinerariifolium]